MTTAKDVADWMFAELTASKYLEQSAAVHEIYQKFGEQFVYDNENGNLAIDKKVLSEFKKVHQGKAEWDRSERAWRL